MLTRILWRIDDDTLSSCDLAVMPLDDDGPMAMRAIAVECYEQLEKRYRS